MHGHTQTVDGADAPSPHRRHGRRAGWFALLFLVACGGKNADVNDTTDPGGDGPNGTNGNNNNPDGPPAGMECDTPYQTPAPGGEGSGACVTEVIGCGEVITATNVGGSTAFHSAPGGPFSQCAGSSSQTNNLDGPERVYELIYPAGTRALHATLKSCEKSWLMWYQGDACVDYPVSCSYAAKGTFYDQEADILLGEWDRIFVVVEGDRGATGNFELLVECFD